MTDIADHLREELRACRERATGDAGIVFPAGTHEVWPDRLDERYCFISNNDDGLKRILLDGDGLEDVVIDGNGAALELHGRTTVAVVLRNSRNVTLRNFSIDWPSPSLSQAEIAGVGDGWADVRFGSEYEVELRDEKLVFLRDDSESSFLHNMLEFDPKRRETAYKRFDNHGLAQTYRAEKRREGVLRIHGAFRSAPEPGNVFVFKHEPRLAPGFVLDNCENIRLENVDVYHAGGMGIVAQCCRDIVLDHFNICCRPGSSRLFSAHADASHFVDCSGRIELNDCLFENQMDDPCNIHGIFWRVRRRRDRCRVELEEVHHQQRGIDTIRAGDRVAFHDSHTLKCLFETNAVSLNRFNSAVAELATMDPLPDLPWQRVVVMRKEQEVDVLIRGCTFRRNRARGLLISSLGRVRIEKNYFHVPGAALRVSGDAYDWFESGPVEDVAVNGNVFDNCNYGVWGEALFDIVPEIANADRGVPFHRNIRVVDNEIRRFHKPTLFAHSVDGLKVGGNRIAASDAYPASGSDRAEAVLGEGVPHADVDL